jgi:5-formyltetrahydrofolate cyclo-ligase
VASSFALAGGARPFAVGVAFECQVVAEVPMESTDRRVDALVTEARSVLCEERGHRDRIL